MGFCWRYGGKKPVYQVELDVLVDVAGQKVFAAVEQWNVSPS